METNNINGQGTLHGTHVAGIIAANGRMKGVAPEATILAYRALGPGGMGSTEQVVAAIDQAIEDRVDILNLSLGNNVNGPDLPISVAINKQLNMGLQRSRHQGIPVLKCGQSVPLERLQKRYLLVPLPQR